MGMKTFLFKIEIIQVVLKNSKQDTLKIKN